MAITQNWQEMLKIQDPLDIDEAMKEQKNRCDELLKIKDSLINKLKGDLKRMDDDYYQDLQKQVIIRFHCLTLVNLTDILSVAWYKK